MRPTHLAVAVALLTAVMGTAAEAQMSVTPFAGVSFAGETGLVDLEATAGDVKPLFGAAVGWRATRRLTVAFEGSWSPRFLKGSGELVERGRLASYFAQADYIVWPASASTRPQLFITGGVGLLRVSLADRLDAFSETNTLAAASLGGGVLVPLRGRWRLRTDIRHVRSVSEAGGRATFDERFVSYWRVTTGVTFPF